jgi:transcriptional regulator GlxA family with amidase domain
VLVAIVALDNAHAVEIAGVRDTLNEATVLAQGGRLYDLSIVAERLDPLRCSSGLRVLPDASIDNAPDSIDTLIVVGASSGPAPPSPRMIEWVRHRAAAARRYGSVCTGAYVLGAAGLLDGRRVTTHWEHSAALAATFPKAIVESDHIFLRDGPLITSAGETSAIDMALSLIEEDCGRATALAVARRLVLYLKRPGSQSQLSVLLAAQVALSTPIERAQTWGRAHPTFDLSVGQLARQAGMSARNFSRVFHEQSGITPHEFVELTRVEAARVMLSDTQLSLPRVARASGFSSPAAMRRAFLRLVQMTPGEFRKSLDGD